MKFDGKVAIVTGAASGIGRATAMAFAAEGASVTLADIDRSGGEDAVRELIAAGGQGIFIEADVSLPEDARKIADQTVTAFGGIDILHNCAGITGFGRVTDLSLADWERVQATNVTSIFLCSKFAVPEMVKRGGGVIVNTSSTQGFGGRPNSVAYSTSKAAILGLTRSMALDHGPDGIRVVAICPGPVDTPMLRKAAETGLPADPGAALSSWAAEQPMGRLGTAEEIARSVLYLASDDAAFVTGSALVVDGGLLSALK